MLTNYLKIAVRNLRRNAGYTSINILGLAVGIACCLLILLFVRHELSYDRFHENADRIHRIVSDWGIMSLPATNPPAAYRLAEDFPEIDVAKFHPLTSVVRYQEATFRENDLFYANPEVLSAFSFGLVAGDAREALERPYTVVLTEEAAERYFGNDDPMGRTIEIDLGDMVDFEVTGVLETVPENSHLHFDFLLSWSTREAREDIHNSLNWGNNDIYTYLLLPEGYDPETLEAQFPDFIERHAGDGWNQSTLSLQPLTDIHLHSNHNVELGTNSDIAYVYIFSVIAIFILVIAGINFVNLATARASERAKEVGLRKAVGAHRGQLALQFLAESVILAFIALGLAFVMAWFSLPGLEGLSGKTLSFDVGFMVPTAALLTVLVGALAGFYPAVAMAGFTPTETLRGRGRTGTGGANTHLRKGLVVFQFATSVCLIVGTITIYNQLSFLRSASLGFDQEQVLVMPAHSALEVDQFEALRTVLLAQPGVQNVSITSEDVPGTLTNSTGFAVEGVADQDGWNARVVTVGHDYFETLGVETLGGRTFSREFPTDSAGIVMNEAAFRAVQSDLPERFASVDDLVGEPLRLGWPREGEVLGVVENFNLTSLHAGVEPVLFFIFPDIYRHFLVRTEPGEHAAAVAAVGEGWRQVFPDRPFEYRFADDGFYAQYRAEERLMQIFGLFAMLAIFIACLGLFGLAAYTAQQRTKEIGIRKVLGATVPSIVALLSKDFLTLVLVGFAVAAPVAYFGMNVWLEDFAYRVDIGAGVFVVAGVLAVSIALLTVSYQAIRTSLTDPVESLRYE